MLIGLAALRRRDHYWLSSLASPQLGGLWACLLPGTAVCAGEGRVPPVWCFWRQQCLSHWEDDLLQTYCLCCKLNMDYFLTFSTLLLLVFLLQEHVCQRIWLAEKHLHCLFFSFALCRTTESVVWLSMSVRTSWAVRVSWVTIIPPSRPWAGATTKLALSGSSLERECPQLLHSFVSYSLIFFSLPSALQK